MINDDDTTADTALSGLAHCDDVTACSLSAQMYKICTFFYEEMLYKIRQLLTLTRNRRNFSYKILRWW